MKRTMCYTLIMYLLALLEGFSQQLTPPIQNFSSVDYRAASQNWGIDVDDHGILYAANNQGLLSFDGQRWELFPLKNGSIIRSVYSHKDRIYIGSYQEFGYWSRTNTGKMFYTSLMPLLGDYTFNSEEFWEILSFKDAIYFRSFGAIYKYKNEQIIPVANVVSNNMVAYKDRLLVAINQKGLHFLEEDGELVPLEGQEILQGKTILDLKIRGDEILIGTRSALYKYDGSKVGLYPDRELNDLLKKSELNQVMVTSEGELVIGTVKNGVIHYNESLGKTQVYNRNNGLQNNTVLSMVEKNGRVWLGLDNGIDAIGFNFPIRFFTDESGELGSVYDLAQYKNELYAASNTGVYKLTGDHEVKMIKNAEGHSWNLEVIGNKLFSNHNTGTFQIEEDNFQAVDRRTGSFEIHPAGESKHLLGTYSGIDAYDEKTGKVETIKGTLFPVKQLVFENPSVVWAAHAYEGLYRIKLHPGLDSAASVSKIELKEEMEAYNVRVYKINNQIAALLGEEWYRFNVFTDSLEVFEEMKKYKGHKLLYEDGRYFWFVNTENNLIKVTDFREVEVTISSRMLNDRLVKGNERLVKVNDSLYYMTLHDGFASINLKELLTLKDRELLSSPRIQRLTDLKDSYDLYQPASIPFKNAREIEFSIGLPYSDANLLKYELLGKDTLKGEVQRGSLKFHNLGHGEYRLNLTALSPQNNISETASYNFSVLAPWYLTRPFKFLYFLFFLALTGLVYWINRLKLKKHRLALEMKYEKEHEEQINRLEKEKLRNEINLKRKELANSTMIAAKKNEVLMEIQGELNKDKTKFSNEYRLKHIMGKINKAIKDKDEWQVFETNFNELHEDFFKDLLAKYPKLSNRDLKLCSYLKMNLSSKEIAPLMGISVRGVEVHRYRLRKKMDLDGSENLTNFLIANF